MMILVRKPHVPDRPSEAIGRRLFGNPDEAFLQSKPKQGLLTPAEIRSMALAELDLGPTSTVWDIGAGSGSVAIEAAQIARGGTVYAIEMDPEDHQLIIENAKRFGVGQPGAGARPGPRGLERPCPIPTRVFVGGSGREISRLVDAAYAAAAAGGRLVATMGSIENLAETHQLLHGYVPRRQGLDDQPRPGQLPARAGPLRVARIRRSCWRSSNRTVVSPAPHVIRVEASRCIAQLDVIAVGAHPDDVEIACGGTLAQLAEQGYRVGIVDLTDGEPTPARPAPRSRLAEAEPRGRDAGRDDPRDARSAQPAAVRHVRGPRGAGQGVSQVPAAAGAGLGRARRRWPRPTITRPC